MTRELLLAVTIALGVALLILMVVGWRRRARRQTGIPELPTVPDGFATPDPIPGTYVATTTAGLPLDRIVARGLGFRGRAGISVSEDGILVDRVGERALWIPRSAVIATGRATWAIDRVVESGGLHVVHWRLASVSGPSADALEFDTYLRLDDPVALDVALADYPRTRDPALSAEASASAPSSAPSKGPAS